jgi:hypothetical protein
MLNLLNQWRLKCDRLICWALARWLLRSHSLSLPKKLAKLECGVFLFCWRLALKSRHIPLLYKYLQLQAEQEYRHAYSFCSFTDLPLPVYPLALKRDRPEWGTLNTGSANEFQADGLSRSHPAARAFFGGIKASEYPLVEQLAFMAVLEQFQATFYEELAKAAKGRFGLMISAIAKEEQGHALALESCLQQWEQQSYSVQGLLLKWQTRKYLAIAVLIFHPSNGGIHRSKSGLRQQAPRPKTRSRFAGQLTKAFRRGH